MVDAISLVLVKLVAATTGKLFGCGIGAAFLITWKYCGGAGIIPPGQAGLDHASLVPDGSLPDIMPALLVAFVPGRPGAGRNMRIMLNLRLLMP